MDRWRTRYFPVLAAYVLHGAGDQEKERAELTASLLGVPADRIKCHHEESVQFLLSNADLEDRIVLKERSHLFLKEMFACLWSPEIAAAREEGQEDWHEAALHRLPHGEERPNKFETVLLHMDSGIALFDSEGTLRFLNMQMARLMRIPRRMLIGQSLRKLMFHPTLRRSQRLILIRMLKQMIYYRRYQGEFLDENGRYLLISISRMEELDGDYLVSVKDVSEYKQIEQSAFQNDKLAMLGKIAAAIAHEIRNPLTSIRGFIQLIKPYLESIGKQEYARIILSEIDRANDIIYEFLNSSKPSAPMTRTVLVGLLLKESILLTESEAHINGIELSCELFDPYMMVSIDVKQIKQVLLNMMKNAMDALQETPEYHRSIIKLTAHREKDCAVIRISDNGKGMDRETLNRLFDPFFTTKEEGTGLGLSVSYRIVRNHGGSIQVESKLNEGTAFMIYLPLVNEKE